MLNWRNCFLVMFDLLTLRLSSQSHFPESARLTSSSGLARRQFYNSAQESGRNKKKKVLEMGTICRRFFFFLITQDVFEQVRFHKSQHTIHRSLSFRDRGNTQASRQKHTLNLKQWNVKSFASTSFRTCRPTDKTIFAAMKSARTRGKLIDLPLRSLMMHFKRRVVKGQRH